MPVSGLGCSELPTLSLQHPDPNHLWLVKHSLPMPRAMIFLWSPKKVIYGPEQTEDAHWGADSRKDQLLPFKNIH